MQLRHSFTSTNAAASLLVEFESESINISTLLLFKSDFEFGFECNTAVMILVESKSINISVSFLIEFKLEVRV